MENNIPRVYSNIETAIANICNYSSQNECSTYICFTNYGNNQKEYYYLKENEILEWQITSSFTIYKQNFKKKKNINVLSDKNINEGTLTRINV